MPDWARGMAETAVLGAARPPYSNRGVTIGHVVEIIDDAQPVFDAYCATVRANPLMVIDYLEQGLMDAGFEPSRKDGPPVRFYGSNLLLVDQQGQRLLSMRHGGRNGFPFVEAKGPVSPAVAEVLRSHFPHHAPSRIDSAHDLRGPGVFAQLHALALQFQRRGVRLDYAGAGPENDDRGTTIYLGSRKSEAFLRIYQKGLKHAEEMGIPPHAIPDALRHWVRVELEFKPGKRPAKERAKSLSPASLWGCSPWIREFATEALSIDAERVQMHERRESNHDRALRWMCTQYREPLEKLFIECGRDPARFGLAIIERADLFSIKAA